MLTHLRVKNFALVDDLTLDLKKNLIIFSGETGSGKSILINAISFLVGEKADKSFIRHQSEFAEVQGIFVLNEKTRKICLELGIEDCDELIISRKIKLDGKSEIRVNGNLITLSMLKNITKSMIDIYGQHQHQCLLHEANHIEFVDSIKRPEELDELSVLFLKLSEIENKLSTFGGDEGKRQREMDILKFEIEELENADLKIGEDETLEERQKKFFNVQKITDLVGASLSALNGDDNFSVENVLAFASKTLNNTTDDKELQNLQERINSIQIELSDIKQGLFDVLDSYNFSEQEFEEVESRLNLIKNLKRKYGGTIENCLNYLNESKQKLEFLQNSDIECQKLEQEKQAVILKINELCDAITQKRKQNALVLEQSISKELSYLGMRDAKLVVDFLENETFTKNGKDNVKFLFSANKGEPLKPLTSVISGGEMSRFMLAFKAIMGNKNGASIMLFDEIDNGIGGEVGFFVGTKLSEISKHAQVIVVTHLASIGAMADQHFKVFKSAINDRTKTDIKELKEDEKLCEIARLAGGINEAFAYNYAKELKQKAISVKNS